MTAAQNLNPETIVSETEVTVTPKRGLLGRTKDTIVAHKGKTSFIAGVATGVAIGIGYSIWRVGGSSAVGIPAGDTPVAG